MATSTDRRALSMRACLRVALVGLVAAGCETSAQAPFDITAKGSFGGLVPFLIIYGAGAVVVVVLAWMALRARQHARMARAADQSVERGDVLREGPAVLTGRVAPGEEPAVRVEILQAASEHEDGSGGWSHRWTERQRRIRVRPFELVLRSGERVLVEPTHEVYLADALDGVLSINRMARALVAQLTPGEAVIAVGTLERRARPDGYRGAADRWVLVPPKGREPMMLSTEPLGARYWRRARVDHAMIAVSLLALVLVHALAAGYHLRLFRGTTVVGSYESARSWTTTDDDGDDTHHRSLRVRLPDGSSLDEEISTSAPTGNSYVRWVRGASWATSYGRTATAWWPLLLVHLSFPFVVLFLSRVSMRRSWYEGAKQDSLESGRIPAPRGRR